ncbi:DNA polymerase III subunit gamma and tau [Citricoccus sp. GCM10030269]|uniref:DNA polymerase III subunit gamma and tau n=1 Tax=Citricoccus sp. GCM10030269 TaxID=3273388 RepID=UPI003609D236
MTTALYRRYRPDSFEDIIGQEHVTVPLMTALSKDRVNHAYLFSGPRGCGKTTSARVLARCLNCAEGPTPNPCGVCSSCQELATGGSGSLDVIEIDAASHGGVDDARDLRERATFAPVRDRYKIFIIDEAHMVTSAGFNALLKIVEEPPPHIMFIFATTEPDKVIGTIRSRTHHYPFRLVPPEPLMDYLERLCTQEGIRVEPGVLSLVIRSGGGSVRDTLSVLDQLMAGAAEGSISYDLAVNLLGYTPDALLDDVVDAVAASDSQTVFRVVDRVVQSGQDPRRFVEDLLERFRDLIITKAMPESASAVLHGMPEDQIRRLETQSGQLGPGEISRAADITNQALTEMVGATSPRLHLELLMARLMLPTTDATERGLAARLDRIERRLSYGGTPESPGDATDPSGSSASPSSTSAGPSNTSAGPSDTSAGLSGAALARAAMKREQAENGEDAQQPQNGGTTDEQSTPPPRPEQPWSAPQPEQTSAPASAAPQEPHEPDEPREPHELREPREPEPANRGDSTPSRSSSQVDMIRRAWPEILTYLEENSRLVWMLVSQNASVTGFDGELLTIGFSGDGPRDTVQRRGGDQIIAEAVHAVLGIRPRLDLITGGSAPAGGSSPKAEGRPTPAASRPEHLDVRPEVHETDGTDRAASADSAGEPHPVIDEVADEAPELETFEEGATGPGTLPPPEDFEADSVPVSDWYPPEPDPRDDGRDGDAPDGIGSDGGTMPDDQPDDDRQDDDEPDDVKAPLSAPPSGVIPRPEPGVGGIPAFARPEAELNAELDARITDARSRSRPTPASAPSPERPGEEPSSGTDVSSAPEAETPHFRRASRFQQMMEQYNRTQDTGVRPGPGGAPQSGLGGAADPSQNGSARGSEPASGSSAAGHGGANGPSSRSSVDWNDDVPSDDDVTIEESGMAGRAVVERLLGARLIEERMLDGSPLS